MKKIAAMILAVALAAGCTTVQYSTVYNGVRSNNGRTPIATVEIENSGWELFKFIPLGSGDPRYPNKCSCRIFRDTVTLQNNLDLLEKEMKATGATRFTNLTSRNSEETFLFIVLTRNAYHTSAVLLKDIPSPNAAAAKEEAK